MRQTARLSLVLFLAACGSQNSTTGDCVAAGTCPADMTMPPMPDIAMAATCSPRCAAPNPWCNDALVCVPCLEDAHCPAGFVCQKGGNSAACVPGCKDDSRCQPDGGTSMACCNNQCVNVTSDAANCGACGHVCTGIHAQGICVDSQCQPRCDGASGWRDCNHDPSDGCETNVRVDFNNCGVCGTKCAIPNAIAACSDGCYLAACNFGWDDCNGDPSDGCEQDVTSDMKNCGACGQPCNNKPHAKNTCVASSCVVTACDLGYSDCDNDAGNGCEVATGTDVKNCGKCGNACPQGLVCVNSACTCPQCNIPNAKSKCVNNQCAFDSCLPGFGDCDNNQMNGCEVNLNTSAANCGACGNACPMNTPVCLNGKCTNQICHDIGYMACPSGATQVCDNMVMDRNNATQAQLACTTCYGKQCVLQNGDCAGLGYSQAGMGGPTWGYQAGCSGRAGRVWPYGNSYTTYGFWAD